VIDRLDREAAAAAPATGPMPLELDQPTRKRSLRRLGLRS